MYKVFIVEDEPLIRKNLKKQLLEYSQMLPLQYCGEAEDGELALSEIIETEPDIVITDIQMPFMDGLTFAKEARKIFPKIRIIFISGFDDFEYAKTALQVQADDYLLKPIKKEDFFQTLKNVTGSLTNLEKNSELSSISNQFVENLKKNHYLNSLFSGNLTVNQAIQQANDFSRTIAGKKMVVLLLKNHYQQNFSKTTQIPDLLDENFYQNENILYSFSSSNLIKCLVFSTQEEQVLANAYKFANRWLNITNADTDSCYTASIGPVVDRISELPTSFNLAKNQLEQSSLLQEKQIIDYNHQNIDYNHAPILPIEINLKAELAKGSLDNYATLIDELLQKKASISLTFRYRLAILIEFSSLLFKEPSATIPLKQKLGDMNQLIQIANNQDLYVSTIQEVVLFLGPLMRTDSSGKYQYMMKKAKTFIDAHYNDPEISLNMVSEVVALSPSHFSTVFSHAVGKTFIEYLTEKRIQEAQLLLKQTNLKLADIALTIGYNDPNYFSFLFRKKTGLSPTEYRQLN